MGRPLLMTCSALVELLSDYCSGSLDVTAAVRVRWHLLLCRGCRSYLAQLRTTIATVGSIRPGELDPQFRARLVEAFRDSR